MDLWWKKHKSKNMLGNIKYIASKYTIVISGDDPTKIGLVAKPIGTISRRKQIIRGAKIKFLIKF